MKSPTRSPHSVRESRYLTMRDRTRLAVDLHRPAAVPADERLPTIVTFTPYFRGMEYRIPGLEAAMRRANLADIDWGDEFARLGFAHLLVEIRGAGASFGTKTSIFSDVVAEDGADVLDWIVEQPWSNGAVGATGISALGLTSVFLAAGKHPALKAIAPRFTVFDIFCDIHPGGLLQQRFLADIGARLRAMDANRLHETFESPPARRAMQVLVKGVRGVDDDRDGSQLAAAVAEHEANEAFDLDIAEVRYRDDRLPHASVDATLDTQSPFTLAADVISSGVPVYAMGGWLDAAFQRAMIHLFCNVPNHGSRLTIGPWAHGGRFDSSPLVASGRRRPTDFDQAGELARFFDLHLRGVDRGMSAEAPVHYFTMGEEHWKEAWDWPPAGATPRRYHLSSGGRLTEAPSVSPAVDAYRVDRTATTGVWSRYGKHLAGAMGPARYPDRVEADRKLRCYTSEPLGTGIEVTGHPVVTLSLACDRDDASLFVYLEDVAPDGVVRVVTDASLRLANRREGSTPPYMYLGTWRTGARADCEPVTPGEIMEVRLDLLPTSWRFEAGHAVRLAIAGADADSFPCVPDDGPPPTFSIHRGSAHAAHVDLPVMPSPGS
jgi:putative CocE/NonD family hydrolase